jgi:site-specific DNA-methyltransferase (adenine-specific)
MTWELHRRDALALLMDLPDASVDALITDPPYSSGGMYRGDRAQATDDKYTRPEARGRRPDFSGDNRDQRSFLVWCSLWLMESTRVLKPGAPVVLFTDWRQLPTVTDALQSGGMVWRGIAVWDKTEGARPQMDSFKAQCEYIVWGTNGPMERDGRVGVLPGLFRHSVKQVDKHHQTGKPTPLMRDVVRICPAGGVVLDPFAGSGTTGVAALLEGRSFIGSELTDDIADTAEARLTETAAALAGTHETRPLFGGGGSC